MRDEFTPSLREILAKRVGGLCSNPECKKLTIGPRTEQNLAVCIGVGAHITAASPNGPRYDPTLTREERGALGNGIWLCQNCAKLVDNDTARYTSEILRAWKNIAEENALNSLAGAIGNMPIDRRNLELSPPSMSNQATPALACLEFLRLVNLYMPRENVSALFDLANVEIDGSGVRIGWEILTLDREMFEEFNRYLLSFFKETAQIRKKNKLIHHYLSVVASGGTTHENELLALDIRKYCESSNNNLGIKVLIGFMAGIRYVDYVFIEA